MAPSRNLHAHLRAREIGSRSVAVLLPECPLQSITGVPAAKGRRRMKKSVRMPVSAACLRALAVGKREFASRYCETSSRRSVFDAESEFVLVQAYRRRPGETGTETGLAAVSPVTGNEMWSVYPSQYEPVHVRRARHQPRNVPPVEVLVAAAPDFIRSGVLMLLSSGHVVIVSGGSGAIEQVVSLHAEETPSYRFRQMSWIENQCSRAPLLALKSSWQRNASLPGGRTRLLCCVALESRSTAFRLVRRYSLEIAQRYESLVVSDFAVSDDTLILFTPADAHFFPLRDIFECADALDAPADGFDSPTHRLTRLPAAARRATTTFEFVDVCLPWMATLASPAEWSCSHGTGAGCVTVSDAAGLRDGNFEESTAVLLPGGRLLLHAMYSVSVYKLTAHEGTATASLVREILGACPEGLGRKSEEEQRLILQERSGIYTTRSNRQVRMQVLSDSYIVHSCSVHEQMGLLCCVIGDSAHIYDWFTGEHLREISLNLPANDSDRDTRWRHEVYLGEGCLVHISRTFEGHRTELRSLGGA
jgi:hypothetical protein